MKTNPEMIAIARDYVNAHIDNDLDAWMPYGDDEETKLMLVYSNLVQGIYGQIRPTPSGQNEFSIKIPAHQREDGKRYRFIFEIV